jgi:hypothetical protein
LKDSKLALALSNEAVAMRLVGSITPAKSPLKQMKDMDLFATDGVFSNVQYYSSK